MPYSLRWKSLVLWWCIEFNFVQAVWQMFVFLHLGVSLRGFTAHVFISCFCFQLFSDLAVYRVFCLRCLTRVLPHKRQLSYLLATSGCYTTAYSLQSGCPLWRRPHYGDGLEKRHSCTTDESWFSVALKIRRPSGAQLYKLTLLLASR